jgi:hypothetical protein
MNQVDTVTEKIDVRSFSKVILRDDSGGSGIFIEQGPVEGLQVETTPEMLRRTEVHVQNEVLYLRLGGSLLERLGDKLTTSLSRPRILYRLQVKELRSLDLKCASLVSMPSLKTDELWMIVCGMADVNVDDLEADRLYFEHSGAGRMQFAGSVRKQDVQLSGTGFYYAQDLHSEQVAVNISGSAHASVYATDTLQATIRGMGIVEYNGNPRLRQRIFGMGTIKRAG